MMENGSSSTATGRQGWQIKPAAEAMRIKNPIRDIVDQLKVPANPQKPLISLSIGDPTVFGNLNVPDQVDEALIANIKSHKWNGYAHSAGFPSARKAIATRFGQETAPLTEDDVVIASGCSGALEMAIGALVNPGNNFLIPAPGFSLYQTILDYKNIEPRFYKLKPEQNWEADLEHLESLIDDNTAGILVNNPSNPCGSVYSKEHLQAILKLAEKHHVPIVADEIYGDIVFKGSEFYSMASLTSTVPILAVGGIAKAFVVPGWRVGWILIHDRNNLFREIRVALLKLSQLILGANTLVQSVLDTALNHLDASYLSTLNDTLSKHAELLTTRLAKIPGLKVIRPGGAMYMMVGFEPSRYPAYQNDVEFAKALLHEQNVFALPATIFQCPNFVRLVITPPIDKLEEACTRIEEFCATHLDKQ